MGDDGQRSIQVSPNSQSASSSSGADIFMRIKNGNGTFVTQATATNTGTGVASQGSVINQALVNGDSYQVNFTSATTYDLTDTTTAATVSTGNAYVSGQAISVGGMQINISGAPASGDTFTIAPSTNVSVFQTISNFITTLNTPTTGNPAATAQLTAGIQSTISGLNNAMSSIGTANAALGSSLDGLAALTSSDNNLHVQYQQTLAGLQSVNMTQAISNLTQEQTILTAAQKSFVSVENLSLFNYIQ